MGSALCRRRKQIVLDFACQTALSGIAAGTVLEMAGLTIAPCDSRLATRSSKTCGPSSEATISPSGRGAGCALNTTTGTEGRMRRKSEISRHASSSGTVWQMTTRSKSPARKARRAPSKLASLWIRYPALLNREFLALSKCESKPIDKITCCDTAAPPRELFPGVLAINQNCCRVLIALSVRYRTQFDTEPWRRKQLFIMCVLEARTSRKSRIAALVQSFFFLSAQRWRMASEIRARASGLMKRGPRVAAARADPAGRPGPRRVVPLSSS